MATDRFERRAVISGVGQSAIGRQVDRSGLQLTIDAILAAVADAGLTLDDIDGLAMFPGGGVANLPGYANGNLYEVQDALRRGDARAREQSEPTLTPSQRGNRWASKSGLTPSMTHSRSSQSANTASSANGSCLR